MSTAAIVDHDACLVYYLAFDLLLAEAPIRDGAVQLDESQLATAGDNPEMSARHAAVRAALLKSYGAGFAADRESEIACAESLARAAGLTQPPAISGMPYAPSNYLIFPTVVGGFGKPTAYLSVVPDGVQAVRWRFACPPHRDSCRPPPQRVAHVTVHGNLAVLPAPQLRSGANYPSAARVTWYRADGSSTTFTNQNAAVPFPGGPAWPAPRTVKRNKP